MLLRNLNIECITKTETSKRTEETSTAKFEVILSVFSTSSSKHKQQNVRALHQIAINDNNNSFGYREDQRSESRELRTCESVWRVSNYALCIVQQIFAPFVLKLSFYQTLLHTQQETISGRKPLSPSRRFVSEQRYKSLLTLITFHTANIDGPSEAGVGIAPKKIS